MKRLLTSVFIFIIITSAYSQFDSVGMPKFQTLNNYQDLTSKFIDNYGKIDSFLKYFNDNNKKDEIASLIISKKELDKYTFSYFVKTTILIKLYYVAPTKIKNDRSTKSSIIWCLNSCDTEISASINTLYAVHSFFEKLNQQTVSEIINESISLLHKAQIMTNEIKTDLEKGLWD